MNLILESTVGLLVVAILVALFVRRLALPYTVGLVAAGIGLAPFSAVLGPLLSHDLIYLVILPPLLFEAAISIHWTPLRRDLLPVLVLSTIGVLISAAVTAAGMWHFLGWPLASALLFGVLIAATDPVAVIALFKDLGLKGRLRLLVESESLFNDGVAAVLFALVLAWARTPTMALDAAGAVVALIRISGGGIAVGLLVAGAGLMLAGRTLDHLVSAALTTAVAYGSFLLAEYFHFSGVLATVAAGLLIGNVAVLGRVNSKTFSARERDFVLGFWEFAAFIANSFIFLLIGITVAQVPVLGLGLKALLTAVALVLLGRLLTVYPLCLDFSRSRWAIPFKDQHILWWGGLRGALALALALSLPESFPFAYEIRIATFGVVIFSVLFQGGTMPLLLRKTGNR
jgi:CPA1 family monovalent cation:H+ antiporter